MTGTSTACCKKRLTNRLLHTGAGGFRVLAAIAAFIWLCDGIPVSAEGQSLTSVSASGDLKAVEALISSGQDVNAKDSLGRSAVWMAASLGHSRIVSRLTEAGAEVDFEDRFGVSPLVVALKRAHRDCVRELLKSGARVNASQRSRFIPLHVAVEQADVEMIFLLLAAGADPLQQQVTGDPGTDLVRNTMIRTRLVGLARNAFLFVGTGGVVELTFPITRRHSSARLTITGSSGTALDSKLSGEWRPPAARVAWDGRDEEGNVLASGDYTFVLHFSDNSSPSIARRVVSFRQLSLHDAAAYGTREIVISLAAEGAAVDGRDTRGRTALMYAAAFGNTGTAEALVLSGADLDATDADGQSAIEYAARFAPGQPVNALLEQAATEVEFSR